MIDLNAQVRYVGDGEEAEEVFALSEFPAQYIRELAEWLGDTQEIVEWLEEGEYTPTYCPLGDLDIRRLTMVNGKLAASIHVGEVDSEFEVWPSGYNIYDKSDPRERVGYAYHWLQDNCKGVWIMTTDQHIKAWDLPHDVYVTFVDPADEAAFKAHMGIA